MCQPSPVRIAYCENIRARQVKMAQPDPQAMAELRKILGAYGADVYQAIEDYLAGRIGPEGLQEAFRGIAGSSHTAAHVLGQEVAGAQVVRGLAADRGAVMAGLETQFFRGFINALVAKDPRYHDGDEWRNDQIARRVEMYLPRTEASAGYGWLAGHEPRQLFDFILGAADHCEDCPVLAEMGPYYRETLWTMPRNGDTPCGFNCKCQVQTVEGDAGFGPAEYQLVEALGLAA